MFSWPQNRTRDGWEKGLARLRQTLDAGEIAEISQHFRRAGVPLGMNPSRMNVGERSQNKGTLMEAGMGDDQLGRVPFQRTEGQQVQIDRSRAVRDISLAPGLDFDLLQGTVQIKHGRYGPADHDRIEEVRLIRVSHGGGAINGRNRLDRGDLADPLDGGFQLGARVAQVGAQRDDHLRALTAHTGEPRNNSISMSDRTIFTFDTTHHALWAEEIAGEIGVPHEVVPAPPAANARCSLALETLISTRDSLAEALDKVGVEFSIYKPGGPSPD